MENTPGIVTVAVETRSGQIGTDVEVRTSTTNFNPTEAIGDYSKVVCPLCVSSDCISMSCNFHAAPGDFTSMNTTILFTENGASEMFLNITIINDICYELMESFHANIILLSPTEPELASRITLFRHQTNISILDEDSEWCLVY